MWGGPFRFRVCQSVNRRSGGQRPRVQGLDLYRQDIVQSTVEVDVDTFSTKVVSFTPLR